MPTLNDTIVALSTPPGVGAIGVVRLSGNDAIIVTNKVFKGTELTTVASHTIHFGTIRDGNQIIDEVLVSVFIAPKSFTKENVVEISCHGSNYILKQVIQLLVRNGARLAKPGEFTQRAFLNGQFDLAQAEAVADLIASDSEASHQAALNQMRGGFSQEIRELRERLVHFASMIELELDFGEEDVEFASRDELKALINELLKVITALISSFDLGNVIKNGVPTVIAGKPNAGKSTLLNALLNEEKAIVSDIPGTTRDFIEDEMVIEGVSFRFIDTAGIRETLDAVEKIGVERTHSKMKEASLILYMFDLVSDQQQEIHQQVNRLKNIGIPYLLIGNKIDTANSEIIDQLKDDKRWVFISASAKTHIEELKQRIVELIHLDDFKTGNTIVTNLRHYESLLNTRQSLLTVIDSIDRQVTNDFVAM
ncbi:MAG: tRNA uridine-5-carboxymethylaminomethyl(34) synthesis GTPase MnmE, partial [Bacteroidota bacterium]